MAREAMLSSQVSWAPRPSNISQQRSNWDPRSFLSLNVVLLEVVPRLHRRVADLCVTKIQRRELSSLRARSRAQSHLRLERRLVRVRSL